MGICYSNTYIHICVCVSVWHDMIYTYLALSLCVRCSCLQDMKGELAQLRVAKVSGGAASKLSMIKPVRKVRDGWIALSCRTSKGFFLVKMGDAQKWMVHGKSCQHRWFWGTPSLGDLTKSSRMIQAIFGWGRWCWYFWGYPNGARIFRSTMKHLTWWCQGQEEHSLLSRIVLYLLLGCWLLQSQS